MTLVYNPSSSTHQTRGFYVLHPGLSGASTITPKLFKLLMVSTDVFNSKAATRFEGSLLFRVLRHRSSRASFSAIPDPNVPRDLHDEVRVSLLPITIQKTLFLPLSHSKGIQKSAPVSTPIFLKREDVRTSVSDTPSFAASLPLRSVFVPCS